MRLKLRASIVLAIIVGLTFPMSVTSLLTLEQRRTTLIQQLESDHRRLAEILALGMKEPLWTFNPESARALIESVLSDERVVAAAVHDKKLGVFLTQEQPQRRRGQQSTLDRDVVYADQGVIGFVSLEMDSGPVDAAIANERRTLVLVATGQLLLSLILIATVLQARLVAPIKRLMRDSELLARRELGESFVWHRDDEIGSLGSSLERTRQALRELFDALDNKNRELRESEEKYRGIYEHALEGIYQVSVDGKMLSANPALAHMLGYDSPQEAVEKLNDIQHQLYVHPEERSDVLATLMDRGVLLGRELEFYRKDGSTIWVSINARAVCDEAGKPLYLEGLITDITQRKKTEEQLRREEERFRYVSLATRDAIYDWDIVTGRSIRNEAYQAMFSPQQPISTDKQWWDRHVHPNDLDRITSSMDLAFAEKRPVWSGEYRFRRADGTFADVIERGYIVYNGDVPMRMIGAITDITERKQAEAELRRHRDHLQELVEERTTEVIIAKDRAEAANRAKSEFLASMSHELRTPLNAILGYAQILRHDKDLSHRQAVGLNTIQQSGEHLLTLINDILDLSKIEAGKLELFAVPIKLPTFLEVITDIIHVRAQQKSVAFDYEVSTELPRAVQGDEKRLRQVLLNLLGNAVKFTDRGRVTLRAQARPGTPGHAYLRFEVQDTGIGIPLEKLAMIFQPFEQASDPQRRRGGTGLGLAISRRLVQAMGSDIEVHSEIGRGSVFSFELELPIVDIEADAALVARTPVGYQGPRKKVLVVDDVAENRAVLVDALAPLGFELFEADDGSVALERAPLLQPDLIVMDTVMPRIDGLTATWQLRAMPAFKRTPIIAVSASASDTDREKTLAVGANVFFAKPIALDEFFDELGHLLRLTWIYEAAANGKETPTSAAPAHDELPAVSSETSQAVLALASLPPELAGQLERALLHLDVEAVHDTLHAVRERDAPLADVLSAFASDFQYDRILRMLRRATEAKQPEKPA